MSCQNLSSTICMTTDTEVCTRTGDVKLNIPMFSEGSTKTTSLENKWDDNLKHAKLQIMRRGRGAIFSPKTQKSSRKTSALKQL